MIYSKLLEGFWDPHSQNVVAITVLIIFKWVIDRTRILQYAFSNYTETFFKCIIRSFPRETVIYWRKVMSDLIKITTIIAALKNRWSKKWPLSKNGLLSSTTDNDWNTQTYWVFPIFSIISSSWLSLIYREAIDFCMFILHPLFLLNYLVNTNRFSVNSLGFSGELILLTASNFVFLLSKNQTSYFWFLSYNIDQNF